MKCLPAALRVLARMSVCLLLTAPPFVSAGSSGNNTFVIRKARVFDGHKVLDQADVWVSDGMIKAVGKNLKVSSDVKVIDGTGKTVLPGFIDSHTHAGPDDLKKAEVFGVTTELDMFTDVEFMQQTKKSQGEGRDLDQADLRSAGIIATAAGGHGTEYGFKIPTLSSPAEAQSWVDARLAEGSDYIKIVVDDRTEYGLHWPTLSIETVRALVDAAHKRGKLAVVHIARQKDARAVIGAGADALVHLFDDTAPDQDFAGFVASHHAFIIPTLDVKGNPSGDMLATDPCLAPYLMPKDIANLKQSFPNYPALSEKYAEETVAQLRTAHVPILAGTDADNPTTAHGASIHRELELLVHSGLTPQEALAAATSVPASSFHLEDRGVIAPGKRADLLLVNGDPTRDILKTRDILSVWKLGVENNRAAYRSAVERAIAQAAMAGP